MASCCLCFEPEAEISLLSCNICQLCLQCYQDLLFNDTNQMIKCNCVNKVTIIVSAGDNLVGDNLVVADLDSDQVYHTTITKMYTTLTFCHQSLTNSLIKLHQDIASAPTSIEAMLRVQVGYLTAELRQQRIAYLIQELTRCYHGTIKTLEREIANLSGLITVYSNLINRNNQIKTAQGYQYYRDFIRPQAVRAITQAKLAHYFPVYQVVIYKEISPIDLNRVGQIMLAYSRKSKSGVLILRGGRGSSRNWSDNIYDGRCLAIKVFDRAKKIARWQVSSGLNVKQLRDEYYSEDKLVKTVTLRHQYDRDHTLVCSLRQYWPEGRCYCSVIPDKNGSEGQFSHSTCLRSYGFKDDRLDGWAYIKGDTIGTYFEDFKTSLDRLGCLNVEAVPYKEIRCKVSGKYHQGNLIEDAE